MSLWRSEDMVLVTMTMQREAVHDTVSSLGKLGLVEFVDRAPDLSALQRQFANEVRRCEELERKLRFFMDQMKKAKIVAPSFEQYESAGIVSKTLLDDFEASFDSYEKELRQLNGSLDQLMARKNREQEFLHVVRQGEHFLRSRPGDEENSSDSSLASTADSDSGLMEESNRQASLGYLTGVISREKIHTFNLLIYRATRGNVIPRFAEIQEELHDSRLGKKVEKNVFIVFFGGGSNTKEKLRKICESLGASIHEYPEKDVQNAVNQSEAKISDLDNTIHTTIARTHDILSEISSNIMEWRKTIAEEKAIYHTMNLFDYSIQNSVIAEGWIPKNSTDSVDEILTNAKISSGSQVHSLLEEVQNIPKHMTPPTFFNTNEFTMGFQEIVNAYGIPRYKEINPAPISIISFPFMFAVMFGDLGHGVILTLFALAMILFSKPIGKIAEKSELVGMIFFGRWVLLLMGLFSIFTGLLYNDCFGLSFNLFGTGYEFKDSVGIKYHTYVFGVDPAWFETANKLEFYNSLKMKMSIVFGICQMMVGIFFSCLNHIQFKHYEDIIFEFIPEVIILGCTFGYLAVMIIIKWCTDFTCPVPGCPECACHAPPPSLLTTMTDFFLNFYKAPDPPLYPGQHYVQLVCLFLVAISIPFMLIPKPFIEYFKHRKKSSDHHIHDDLDHGVPPEESSTARLVNADSTSPDHIITLDGEDHVATNDSNQNKQKEEEEDEVTFADIFIRQMIHTIEFSLGSVSNTASYLRLWALSLAHAQLSEVFYGMTLNLVLTVNIPGLEILTTIFVHSGLAIIPAFAVWFSMTIGVLLIMESLSAFLHALRLHWVEFQNKFFAGDGHLFEPFNLGQITKQINMEDNNDDDE